MDEPLPLSVFTQLLNRASARISMNSNDNSAMYNPADDDNQGVVQLLAQGEEANSGVSQIGYMNPVTAQGPEPEKAEVDDSDVDANGVNDDLLAEEEVEDGDADTEEE